jgi:hypothetical protein
MGEYAAIWDLGYVSWDYLSQPSGTNRINNNHKAGYYNVAFYDGAVIGVPDPGFAQTAATSYYSTGNRNKADYFTAWLDSKR